MTEITDPVELEKKCEFETAATEYALWAVQTLEKGGYEDTQCVRRSSALILRALSADVRAGCDTRARLRYETFKGLFERFQAEAEKPVLIGLSHEWLGDAALLLREPTATEHYWQAKESFADIDIDSQMFWGAQPEYDYERGAMRRFFEEYGVEYYRDDSLDFEGRVQFKLDAIEEHDLLTENTQS